MNALKDACYKVLSSKPFLRLGHAQLRGKVVALMYHELANDADDIESWMVVRRSDFLRQIDHLSSHFTIVSLAEALGALNAPAADVSDKPLAVITFDDGYAGNHDVLLPIIDARRIPVTIFLATEAIQDQRLYWYDRLVNELQDQPAGRYDLQHHGLGSYRFNETAGASNWVEIQRLLTDLKALPPDVRAQRVTALLDDFSAAERRRPRVRPLSIDQVRTLARSPWITIGAHSHCHNLLPQLSRAGVDESVQTSKRLIESWIGRPVDAFAYPNGDYNDDVVASIRDAGFTCGMTTVPKPWRPGESRFALPRIGVGRYDAFDRFALKISGLLTAFRN